VNEAEALRELERLATLDKLKSVDVYLAWAAEVEDLLPYSSEQFQHALREQLDIFNDDYETKRRRDAAAQRIDKIVDEAISFLRDRIKNRPKDFKASNAPSPKPEVLKMPERVTLTWLFQNVSVGQWIGFAVFLAAVFGLGVGFGRSQLYESLTKQSALNSEQAPSKSTKP